MMAPGWALTPLVILAALATVVASQSIISGAFSISQQAVRLGYAPRMRILHTSSDTAGQVYVPAVNAVLFVAVIGLVLSFKSSAALAAAFGLTVTATMVLTTLMVGYIIFFIWRWKLVWAGPLYALLLTLDLALFAALRSKPPSAFTRRPRHGHHARPHLRRDVATGGESDEHVSPARQSCG